MEDGKLANANRPGVAAAYLVQVLLISRNFAHLLSTLRTTYLAQAFFLDVFPALEDSGFAGNLSFLETLP